MRTNPHLLSSFGLIQRDPLVIDVRAFVPPLTPRKNTHNKTRKSGTSEFTLVFDIETTTDAAQQMRFGVYHLFKGIELVERGFFVDTETMNEAEQAMLSAFATAHGIEFMTRAEFVENVFYGKGYDFRATIVGFNLPFDLSRLAIGHASARGKTMRGGFSLQLSPHWWRTRVQVKHLSGRAALIQFTKPKRRHDSRGMRNRRMTTTVRRGAFVDVKTLAAALTSRSFTLKGLADFLQTDHRKLSTDEHGGPLTEAYVAYAMQDVLVTWECYRLLLLKFEIIRTQPNTSEPGHERGKPWQGLPQGNEYPPVA